MNKLWWIPIVLFGLIVYGAISSGGNDSGGTSYERVPTQSQPRTTVTETEWLPFGDDIECRLLNNEVECR